MTVSTTTIENDNRFKVGDKVSITVMNKMAVDENSVFRRNVKGRVIFVHPQYITVDNGSYCESFNKIDFYTGKVVLNAKH